MLSLSLTQPTNPSQQILAIVTPYLVGHQINEESDAVVTGILQRRGEDNWYVNPFLTSPASSIQTVNAEKADYYSTGKLVDAGSTTTAELLLKTGTDNTIIFGETLALSRSSDNTRAIAAVSQKLTDAINRHAQSNLVQANPSALNPLAVDQLAEALIRFWTDPEPTPANSALIRAVELAPNFSDAWLMLAELTDRDADQALWQRAVETADQQVAGLARLDELRVGHYRYGFLTPDLAKNTALLEAWQVAAPQDLSPRLALALSAREPGDLKTSIEHLISLTQDISLTSDALRDRVEHELTHNYMADQQ